MFNALTKDSVFYILDKNTKPTLKVGKVTKVETNPQYYGLSTQEVNISVDVNGDAYEFKKIPSNCSIISPSAGIVISDNKEDMTREFETLVSVSQQHIDNIEYDKLVVESKDSILSILNPQFAKEKEQEVRFTSLESRVGGVEKGINDIKSLLVEALNKKG